MWGAAELLLKKQNEPNPMYVNRREKHQEETSVVVKGEIISKNNSVIATESPDCTLNQKYQATSSKWW